jgi:hypothetical protein
MGLNDEAEKLRQAEEWLHSGTPEQVMAAWDHICWVYNNDALLQPEAARMIRDTVCPYGCMPEDHGC